MSRSKKQRAPHRRSAASQDGKVERADDIRKALGLSSRIFKWTIITSFSAVIATICGFIVVPRLANLWDALEKPFDVISSPLTDLSPGDSKLFVTDVARLDRIAGGLADGCDELWSAALQAGGVPDGSLQRILLQGKAITGATIIDMSATLTNSSDAPDGAFVACHKGGGVSPIPISFNLGESNTVQALHQDWDSGAADATTQFGEGYVIHLAKDEIVPLRIAAYGPIGKNFEWHITADVVVAGMHKKITIDDNGRPFRGIGMREQDSYSRGYIATYDGPITKW